MSKDTFSFEVSSNELDALRKDFRLAEWVESMPDMDKRRLAASFDNPVEHLRVMRELQEKYRDRASGGR